MAKILDAPEFPFRSAPLLLRIDTCQVGAARIAPNQKFIFVCFGLNFDSSPHSTRIYVTEIHASDCLIHFTRTQSENTIFPLLFKTSHDQEVLLPCPKCAY